jgi:hypothetical protein
LEIEYIIESSQFEGNDSRNELEYDGISSYEEDDDDYEKNDVTTGPETSPEPTHSVEDKGVTVS